MPFRNPVKVSFEELKQAPTKIVYLFSSTVFSEKNLFIIKMTVIVLFHRICYLLGPILLHPLKSNPAS